MFTCKICNNAFNKLSLLSFHVRRCHKISAKEYYDRFIKKTKEGICKNCGKETKFRKFHYNEFCSRPCIALFLWKDNSYRTLVKKQMNIASKNPLILDIKSKNLSERNKKNWKNPEYRNEMKKICSMASLKAKENRKNNAELMMRHIKQAMFNSKRGIYGYYDSIGFGRVFYRSSYELQAYKLLDKFKFINVTTEPFKIDYEFEGCHYNYIPDLQVQDTDGSWYIIEVKPQCFLKNPKVIAKHNSARKYCNENGATFLIWNESHLFGKTHV